MVLPMILFDAIVVRRKDFNIIRFLFFSFERLRNKKKVGFFFRRKSKSYISIVWIDLQIILTSYIYSTYAVLEQKSDQLYTFIECEEWRRHSSLIFLIPLFTKPNIEISGWLYQTKTHFTHIVFQPFSSVSPPSFTLYHYVYITWPD